MPTPRATHHHRRARAHQSALSREIERITLAELQRLWRDLRIKLRRLDARRPKLATIEKRHLSKAAFFSHDIWAQFQERLLRRLWVVIKRSMNAYHKMWEKHIKDVATAATVASAATEAVTAPTVPWDQEQVAAAHTAELEARILATVSGIQKSVGKLIAAWYHDPAASTPALVSDLEEAFSEQRAKNFASGEVSAVHNRVTDAVAASTGAVAFWVKTMLDENVCVHPMKGPDGGIWNGCRDLHGRVFSIWMPGPPFHKHCRCERIPIVDRRVTGPVATITYT
jgi:hypothetical protein